MGIQDLIKEKINKENLKPNSLKKKILLGVILLLFGALGLESFNSDFDLGAILSGSSVSNSKIERDASGNLQRDSSGNFITQFLRDKTGKVVPQGTAGAKYTNEYNCDDFSTQAKAQLFFENAGGLSNDTNRLDGDKDGIACENLPKGIK